MKLAKTPTQTPEQPNRVAVVFDPDDAGKAAAIDAVFLIHDLFDGWGTPKHENCPDANALAVAERAYSDLKRELHGRMALGLDTIQTESDMSLVWEYAESLRAVVAQGPSLFDLHKSLEEYETAVAVVASAAKPRIDYKEIKKRIKLADYIGQHTQLKRRGNKYIGKCPLPDHQDDTASLHIYPDQSWYCFGCRRGGDLFHYVKLRGTRIEDLG